MTWSRRRFLAASGAGLAVPVLPREVRAQGLVTAWHSRTLQDHVKLRDDVAKNGFRFLSLSIYGAVSAPFYAAVMIKRPAVVAQRDWPVLTFAQLQQTFDDQAKQGYGPVIIAATGTASDPRFAAVFEPQNPLP